MRRYIPTLANFAAALALALALVVGVLLPADNAVYAADPVFDTGGDTRSIPENTPPGVNIGNPISATDTDPGDVLSYSLSGTDAASFDIDASTGQIITKAALNEETKSSYSVTVTAKDLDPDSTDPTQTVSISVTDVNEPPLAPVPPVVTSGADTTSLVVSWFAPDNAGRPDISAYAVEYKKVTSNAFTDTQYSGADVTHTITALDADTAYHVRVRATNGEGTGPWSLVGTGSTNVTGNAAPTFSASPYTLSINENYAAGQTIGTVKAGDDDSTTLVHSLEGPGADSFEIVASSGDIKTKTGVDYNFEKTPSYGMLVKVVDREGGSGVASLTVNLTDQPETPDPPGKPKVVAGEDDETTTGLDNDESTKTLKVTWDAPAVNKGPAITGADNTAYIVEYRKGTASTTTGNFVTTNVDVDHPNRSATITGLTAGTDPTEISYQVRVKANNGEGTSNYSAVGVGSTEKANSPPKFSGSSATLNVRENTAPNTNLRRFSASDADGDTRTYSLEGTNAASFTIDSKTGQLRTKATLNHEAECSAADAAKPGGHGANCTYSVTVKADDGTKFGTSSGTILVTINVSDSNEPPSKPDQPTVYSNTTPTETTSVVVVWDVPDNTGPAIQSYEVEYRSGGGYTRFDGTISDGSDGLAGKKTATITGLTADTQYEVRVRAVNEEGTSPWSSSGRGRTNEAGNALPTFSDTAPAARSVQENSASNTNVGIPFNMTDTDDSTATFSLEGTHRSLFSIGSKDGQIKTRKILNHEAECSAADADQTGGHDANCTYSVIVKLQDPKGGSSIIPVTITVTDVSTEKPTEPAAPRVVAAEDDGDTKRVDESTTSLVVTWTEPKNTGPSITRYDIDYKVKDGGSWLGTPITCSPTSDTPALVTCFEDRKYTITGLDDDTTYEVRVNATNDEGTTDWSKVGTRKTVRANNAPEFSDGAHTTRNVVENTRSGQAVGGAVGASDEDGNRLTYRLEGPNKDSFTVVSSTGQIRTKAALDYESQNSYSLTVTVDDGTKAANSSASISVTVYVTNVDEPPIRPAAPSVRGVPGSTTSVQVTWDAPKNDGRPPITDYRVEYREGSSGEFRDWNHEGIDTSTIITGLETGKTYQVKVLATNANGDGEWSPTGSGRPDPDVKNRAPTFSASSQTFSIAENTTSGVDVGTPLEASDLDRDILTYSLEGADMGSFDIDISSGQIRTKAALDYEKKRSYSLTVRVQDGRGGSATLRVTISITDLVEPPGKPAFPTVTAISSTSLQVNWDAPENTGPPITDYDYRYRAVADSDWTEVTNTTITGTTVTIEGLTPSTSYDVEVRAKNAEGMSEWSDSEIGTTNAPGANNPPVFTDGASATRSVSAGAAAGAPIGDPIAATDADTGDTLTYSLEGRDAANFDINASTGQLLTKSGVTLIIGDTYTVTVAVSDTKDTTRISVSIVAIANNAPVFSGGARSFSVRENAPAGSSIGSPVRATDADGDTLTYTLEGTDAASFDIRSAAAGGQIVTRSGVTLTAGTSYSVTVVATDGKAGRATVAVTIAVTQGTFNCAIAVPDSSNTGLVADCQALLRAKDTLRGSASLNWSESTSITQWDGVYVRGTPSRVTWIILRGNSARRLSGTIPAELGQLSALTIINLRSNTLTGQIPNEIGNLTNLEQLLLHNNSLSGDFPNLSRLSRLKKLWLSGANNRIGEGDGIPRWLNNLTALEELNLWGNEMGGEIPNLSGLSNLKLLKLQNNNLTGSIPAWFGSMNSLSGLYLHANRKVDANGNVLHEGLTGSIPSQLGRLTRLRRLWLDRNDLSGPIPPALGNMTNLGTLNLHTNRLSGGIPAQLGNLSRLQHLALHNNRRVDANGNVTNAGLTGPIPTQLGALGELTRLAVSNNDLAGPIPSELGSLGKLRLLWLSQNRLSGTIPAQLGDLGDTLTHIKLASNSFDANACLPSGIANVGSNDYAEAGLSACP